MKNLYENFYLMLGKINQVCVQEYMYYVGNG